ncbi:hypothetical protein D3C83_61020 [compost metagenome]
MEQIVLDATARQVIEDLIDDAARAAMRRQQLFHLANVEVAHAPVADLTGRAQVLEAADRLRQRVMRRPMQQVKIDAIGAQALQARFARAAHAAAARI